MIRHLKTFSFSFLCAAFLAAHSPAATTPVATWFDFTGWDHTTVVSSSQTFPDIWQGIDVTVSGLPGQSRTSYFDGQYIRSGADTGRASFTFEFDRPLDLIIEVHSLDKYETLTIDSSAAASYIHAIGALPTILGPMTLTGNGIALGADGAARGWITLDNADSFTWTYDSIRNNKYEWFRLGAHTVPEPCSLGLLAVAGVGLLARRRRSDLPAAATR